jgi:hypothetical protein
MTGEASSPEANDLISYDVPRLESPPTPAGVTRRSRFTPDAIVDAIQRWADRYGEPPTSVDWDAARARRVGHVWRATRFEAGEWPSTRVTSGVFGSFNAAIEAAGYIPRPAPVRLKPNLAGPQSVLAAIREWTRRYGDVPAMADWDPARARRLKQDWRIARYYGGDWPSVRTVAHHFGSLSRAVAAAGLEPREPSSQWTDRSHQRAANLRTMAELGAARREPGITDVLDCLQRLSAARRSSDPVAARAALIDLASAALAWAEAPHVD